MRAGDGEHHCEGNGPPRYLEPPARLGAHSLRIEASWRDFQRGPPQTYFLVSDHRMTGGLFRHRRYLSNELSLDLWRGQEGAERD